jgi:hypothetical protein
MSLLCKKMKDPLGRGRMRTRRPHFGETRLRGAIGPIPNRAGACCWGPMGAGGRHAESCASGLPYAMGRRALLFLMACRAACATAATLERSFQSHTLAQVLAQFLQKSGEENGGQKLGIYARFS